MSWELTEKAKQEKKLWKALKKLRLSSMSAKERIEDDLFNDPNYLPWITVSRRK